MATGMATGMATASSDAAAAAGHAHGLCAAVEGNKRARLDELLRGSAACAAAVNEYGVNSATDERHTPLMIACCEGRPGQPLVPRPNYATLGFQ